MSFLLNIDVPDLKAGERFYREAFGLETGRRLGDGVVELLGWPVPVYLLEKPAGSVGAGADRRRYERHWTPMHADVVVSDIEAAVARAVGAGATLEVEIATHAWGRIAMLADPFGHGFCLIQFLGRGYDEIALPA
ncbi:MAG: VOC family protein [Proteobacteria bacterium]|nr:VOC family protein [Pseudomonadota bacterium]